MKCSPKNVKGKGHEGNTKTRPGHKVEIQRGTKTGADETFAALQHKNLENIELLFLFGVVAHLCQFVTVDQHFFVSSLQYTNVLD